MAKKRPMAAKTASTSRTAGSGEAPENTVACPRFGDDGATLTIGTRTFRSGRGVTVVVTMPIAPAPGAVRRCPEGRRI